MLLRLSSKRNTRIKGGMLNVPPRFANPLFDWLAQAFVAVWTPQYAKPQHVFWDLMGGAES